jgi:hypothetical protein
MASLMEKAVGRHGVQKLGTGDVPAKEHAILWWSISYLDRIV